MPETVSPGNTKSPQPPMNSTEQKSFFTKILVFNQLNTYFYAKYLFISQLIMFFFKKAATPETTSK